MSPRIYIAIRQGVYRHEIVMASTDLDKVIEAAKKSIEEEPDHYHNVEVIEMDDGGTEERSLQEYIWLSSGGVNDTSGPGSVVTREKYKAALNLR